MPATRTLCRRKAGSWRPKSAASSARGARRGCGPIITASRTSSTSSRSAIDGKASAICRERPASGFESISTFKFDPIGWKGAKLDATFGFERDERERSADRREAADQRHPGPLGRPRAAPRYPRHAARVGRRCVDYGHYTKYYLPDRSLSKLGGAVVGRRVTSSIRTSLGLTVRADVGNLLNARHRLRRATVYADWRDTQPARRSSSATTS